MKKLLSNINKRLLCEILIIFSLSLFPLNWFPGDMVITGHDSGNALTPVDHFLDRLYVWTNRWGLGSDQSYALGAFFIHGLEALISWMGASLQWQQKINYIFWLFIPGLTMYIFAYSVFPKRRYFPLIAAVFFMFNHFLLQGWMVTERTKFSTYAVLPLIILYIFKMYEGRFSAWKAGVLTAVSVAILNGGGNMPLFGAIFVIVPFALLYYFVLENSFKTIKKIAVYVFSSVTILIALSSYWLMPYVNYAIEGFSRDLEKTGGIGAIINWSREISKNASVLNIYRLQGIPDWYNNPLHPYANVFLENDYLILTSFAFPLLAFAAWFFAKKIKEKIYVLFFIITALIGIIFTSGSHPPFGIFYEFLLQNIPGFVVFRTPYYKFAPLVFFAYSFLIAFSLSELLFLLGRLKISFLKISYFLYVFIIAGILIYNYPVFDGKFFDYQIGLESDRLSIPKYVYDFQKWADSSENRTKRSILLPGLGHETKYEVYKWKYFSLTTLTTLLTRETFITKAFYNFPKEDVIIDSIYENLLNNEEGWDKLAAVLGVQNFVARRDFEWNRYNSKTRRSEEYEAVLENSSLVNLNKIFGEWRIYSFKEGFVNPLISATYNLSYVIGDPDFTRYLTSIPEFNQKQPMYFQEQNSAIYKNNDLYNENSNKNYVFPKCVTCDLKKDFLYTLPTLLPGSVLYKIMVQPREDKMWSNSVSLEQKIDFLLTASFRRLLEVRLMTDSKNNLFATEDTLKRHSKFLKELNNLMKDEGVFNSDSGNNTLIQIENYMYEERASLEYIFNNAFVDEKIINDSYFQISEILEKTGKWVWRTRDEKEKRYAIEVKSPGKYNLWLRKDRFELPENVDLLKMNFKYSINSKEYNKVPQENNKSWLLLDRVFLDKGFHRIKLDLPSLELFKGEWEFLNGKKPFEFINNDSIYTIKSKGDRDCVLLPVNNLVSGSRYRVSFSHRRISGDQDLRVLVDPIRRDYDKLMYEGDKLKGYAEWRDYQKDLPLITSNKINIHICTDFYRDPIYSQNTNIEIKDISVRKISAPIFAFEKTEEESVQEQTINVSFERINQTKYKVHVENSTKPFILTFSQRFTPGWKAYHDSSKKYNNAVLSSILNPSGIFSITNLWRSSIPEENHFLSNGYANSWYIDKIGSFDLIIEYRLQHYYYIGITATLFAVVVLLFLLLRKNNKQN